MSEKLFYSNSYICESESNIENIIEKDGKYEVVLDKTPFFPEGGGQLCDTGFIDDIPVEYVHENGDTIYHVVSKKPKNTKVKCKVDFDRRLDNTQQHSGEHLLSAAFFKLYNAQNKGFHMSDNYVTIDIDLKDITDEMLKAVEIEANSYIYKNEPTQIYFKPKEEAEKLPLRKAIKAEGMIRIVKMGDFDCCACCGTHVNRSGEVGIIKILKSERYKGMTRIYFKCGKKALLHCMEEHSILMNASHLLSVDSKNIINKIKKQNNEINELNSSLKESKKKIAQIECKELISSTDNNLIYKLYYDKDFEEVNSIYECLKNEPYILILASLKDNKIIFGNNGEPSVNCGKIFKENIKNFNGKGGGNAKRAQAAFTSQDDLKNFAEFLMNECK